MDTLILLPSHYFSTFVKFEAIESLTLDYDVA